MKNATRYEHDLEMARLVILGSKEKTRSRARSSNDDDEDDDSSHDCTLGTAGVDCRTLAHRGPGSGGREHADVPASRRISPPPP